MSMDTVQETVESALHSIRTGSGELVAEAFHRLSALSMVDVIAELCLCIDDLAEENDLPALLRGTKYPLPERPEELLAAVKANDFTLMHAYAGGEMDVLMASLMTLVVTARMELEEPTAE